jgi:threonine/homoserine/homoserine lactone efflux protein
MILKGFKFGMLLQLAIGPMCLMVFNTSITYGCIYGIYVMSAIALVDVLYIGLACIGVASIINRTKVKRVIKLGGCLVLSLYGVNTMLAAFDFSFLPISMSSPSISNQSLFVQVLLLTLSNPLTIVFWSSMFSTQMIKNEWSKKQLFFFAVGCVLSTVVFLTIIAFLGSELGSLLPHLVIQILNMIVGIFLFFFGIKLLCSKNKISTQ